MGQAMVAVIYVSSGGVACVDRRSRSDVQARLSEERARLAEVRAAGAVPESCGPEIPAAPARGPGVAFQPRRSVMTPSGPRGRRDGWQGRDALRVSDAFDRMHDQAKRAHARKGKDAAPFVPPFTPGQEQVGRSYAALSERVAACGVKCSSIERGSDGGAGLTVSEAVQRDLKRLAALHRRIGDGLAKDVVRPSQGGARMAIRVRALVDGVCLGDQSVGEVAARFGWGNDARLVERLRVALAAALDRMQGYDRSRPQNMN